ncbi:hypothetical protein SLS60_009964 [Paraconiothyrium brasiliense]|uniref:Rhodopsin domain-containing protein n=1 Tax=Paraconiothyrium brasiliense TaxID=300254 RepID=A0ABR3QTQ8_9PLEO
MDLPTGMDLSAIPLMPNPSGAPPDFEGGPSLRNAELVTGIALMAVSGTLLVFRIATNLKIARKLGLDDMLCIFAYAGGIAYWALTYSLGQKGAAKHAWDIPLSTITTIFIKLNLAILFVISPTMWAAKAAILSLYIRIFGSITWIRRFSYFWIAFMALFYAIQFVIGGVYCVPRKGEAWDGASFQRCSESAWLQLMVGVFSCLADILILILPFPIILKLQISVTKKVTLSIVFGVGAILVGLSMLALYYRVIIFKGIDTTWNGSALSIVTHAEVFGTVSISCALAISSFWCKILTESTLWTELKSSFLFSSLSSRFSRSSLEQETPSFVISSSRKPSSSQTQLKSSATDDSERIFRETAFENVREKSERSV